MKSLKGLSDRELLGRLNRLVQNEHKLTLDILAHLAEVARRELYLARGYSTLADYCIGEMGYGESSAWRRVRVARMIKDVPEVYDVLKKRALTFSAVLQVAKVLTPENKDELLARIVGRSKSEIERIVAEYGLPLRIPDQAKPRIVSRKVPVEAAPAGASLKGAGGAQSIKAPDVNSRAQTIVALDTGEETLHGTESGPELGEISLHSEGKFHPTLRPQVPEAKVTRTVFEKMYEVRFAGDEELMELMSWMRTHLSGRFPKGASFAEMFKYAMKYVREREDPAERQKRRDARKQTKTKKATPKNAPSERSRYIPQNTRDRVWTRDHGRCTYVGANGKRCNSTYNIQFDHYPVPFARGGPSTANNLRLLCAKHNRHTAKAIYGEQHMIQFQRRE